MVETKPDIVFVISIINQFIKNPSHQYNKVVKTFSQYLKATKEIGITYGEKQRGDLIIQKYSNSN